jgi:uncharacterized protein YbjT (DUF2867 family)
MRIAHRGVLRIALNVNSKLSDEKKGEPDMAKKIDMGNKKVMVVVGATGAQGGGLARAVLSDKNREYSVRALTRNPSADKAEELATLGAEVVAADIVWSTLEDTRKKVPLSDGRMPTLQGRYKVPHFDGKGQADAYFRDTGLPTTYLLTSFYWDNFTASGMGPQRGPHGELAILLPIDDRKLPGIAAEDIGKCAYGVFKRGGELVGKTVGIAGGHLTGAEMAAGLSGALEQPIAYKSVSPAVYRSFGFPGADDLGNMFQYKRDFNDEYCAARSVAFSRSLNPELMSFADWLQRCSKRIRIPPVSEKLSPAPSHVDGEYAAPRRRLTGTWETTQKHSTRS